MENLWQKESHEPNEYIDLFAKLSDNYGHLFNDWDYDLSKCLEWLNWEERFVKNNNVSMELLCQGDRKFLSGNINGAIVSYNQSLCFAMAGSVHESLTYANRAECYSKLGEFANALIDIELASKWNQSNRIALRLEKQRANCYRYMRMGYQPTKPTMPKLSYKFDKRFPCMANVLEIRQNNEFGRHIVAKCNINVGKTIIVTDMFASGTSNGDQPCCRNCNKNNQNLIACTNCSNTMFCFGNCSNNQLIHQLECSSIFHMINETSIRLVIQTILMAISMFPTHDYLIEFVENSIKAKQLTKETKDLQTRYGLFLNLWPYREENRIYPAYKAYTTLLVIPQIKKLFDSERKRNFLMHLTLHHSIVIQYNAFSHSTFDKDWITTDYIYDVMSLINHSCVANAFNFSIPNEIGYCVTLRKIKKGEQIFINYLGLDAHNKESLKLWNFECKCEKCVPSKNSFNENVCKKIRSNRSFKYIKTNCRENYCNNLKIRPKLKNECLHFLQQFGHLVLIPEVGFVRRCFALH